MLFPYIRGTNKEYGTPENGGFWGPNGFNCIEVGYLEFVDDELTEVYPLTMTADVVHPAGLLPPPMRESMRVGIDCVGEGYLRIFAIDGPSKDIKWEYDDHPALSSMTIEFGKPKFQPKELDREN